MTSLPCPPEHWARFSSLLDTAMDLPEERRAGWLHELPDRDAAMRPWLTRVLNGAAGLITGAFPDVSRLPCGSEAKYADEEFVPGDMIGPYCLVELLGEGGMGRVWRAQCGDDGPQRDVALKLPHAELLAGPYRRRFRQERDVLASLSHPNIAALYDAGVSADGHPYLALELVEGEAITAWCRNRTLSLERRVDLVCAVLAALDYAHARLIVHRDIKPSNVMVTTDGVVKLLDFGIAKLLDVPSDPASSGEGPMTHPANRLATPGYGAPEQFDGAPVTVSADFFAAGALLFELCTGSRLRPVRQRGDDLPLASATANANDAGLMDGAKLAGRLRGDLDAIIARALITNPAERYQSAEAFARDLRCWQQGLPVSARPVGRFAVAGKFIRRNRAMTALAGVLALAVAGGTSGIAWQAARAEREAAHAAGVRDFLIGLFEAGDPHGGGKPNDEMTARALLDSGADRADAAFAADPATEIDLLATLGQIYDAVDEGARAEKVWSRRLDLLRKVYGPSDQRVVDGTLHLVRSEVNFLDEDRAKTLLDSIRAPLFARTGRLSLQRAEWLAARAQALRITHGGRDEAIAEDMQAVAIYERGFSKDPGYADTLVDLSDYQYDAEDFEGSLATIEKMRAVKIATHNFDAMDELNYLIYRGLRLERMNRLGEADAMYTQAQTKAAAEIGQHSSLCLYLITTRAQMYHMSGDRTRADQMLLDSLSGDLKRAAATGQSLSLRRSYGAALLREGRAAEAIPVLEQALAATRVHPKDEQNLRRSEAMLGDAYDQVGRTADARSLLRQARDEWLQYGPAAGVQSMAARERWARFLLDHGGQEAAEAEFLAVLNTTAKAPVISTAMAAAGLARIALSTHDISAADQQSAHALSLLQDIKIEYNIRLRVDIWLVRVQVLHSLGRDAQAHGLAQQALQAAMQYDAPGTARIEQANKILSETSETSPH